MMSKIRNQKDRVFEIKYKQNELLYRNLAVYILNNFVTKKKIFKIHHNDSFLNHFTCAQIENMIRRKYF